MGGSSKTSSTNYGISNTAGNSTTTPWDVQTPYVKQAFDRADAAYNQNMANGPYRGDYVAQDNGQQAAAFNNAYNFAMDPNRQAQIQGQLNSAQNVLQQGADWANKGVQGVYNLAGDQTQGLIDAAGRYADNPGIAAAVRAAMFDANRQASENDLPNMYRAAAGSNALNSDRAALGQGVVERGLNDLAGNISANMHYNAWGKGLDTAQNELNARRQSYGAVSQLGQGMYNSGNAGYAQGIENQSRLNQMAAAAGAGNQQLAQDRLNNEMAKYEGNQNFPWAALQNYYNIIGNRSWGGNTNYNQTTTSFGKTDSQTQNDPGVAGYLGAAVGGAGSLFQSGANGSPSAAANMGTAGRGLFSFLSEDTEKVDVQPVGKLPNGIPLYAYRYKGDPKHYPKVVGPMASEVEEIMPEAVTRIAGGPRIVDYAKVFA